MANMSVKKHTIVDLPDRHPYFKACRKGDLPALRSFYEEDVSVYASGPTRAEAMTEALASKNYPFMDLLFEFGFEVDHPLDAHGNSPLVFALRTKDAALVHYFLGRGADVNCTNDYGFTPIFAALGDLTLFELLGVRGANLHARTNQGYDLFRVAADAARFRMMEYLLSKGFDVNTRNAADTTPLIGAAQGGALEICRWLLEHGADKNAHDKSNKTALDYARMNKHTHVVELLEIA